MEIGKPYFSRAFIVPPIASLLFGGLCRDEYRVYMSKTPVMPATRVAAVKPTVAPRVPNPKNTSAIIRPVLAMAWIISMMLFRCNFSMPVKAALAVVIMALLRINMEAIWIN